MRKFVFSFLLASVAATPALAAPGDWNNRDQSRAERQQAREDRQSARDQNENARRSQASQKQQVQQQQVQQQQVQQQQVQQRPNFEPRQRFVAPPVAEANGRGNMADVQAMRDARRQQANTLRDRFPPQGSTVAPRIDPQGQRQIMRDRADERRQDAQERIANRGQMRPPLISPVPRPGMQPPPPVVQRPVPAPQWNSDWRRDRHYDWNDYRRHHRSLFNLGFYYDPFGWGYQPYSIGWRMWPSFYSSQYWLNDPWQYRLPYAPVGYRWVRYWDDAVLVDTWSGQVVDVIYSFFW